MRKLFVVLIILFAWVAPRDAVAQDTTGTLSGRIVDAQGLALPGVTVTAVGAQGSKVATTDSEGRFTLPYLTPGAYAIHAELPGFMPLDQRGVDVHLGQTVEVRLALQVGALT